MAVMSMIIRSTVGWVEPSGSFFRSRRVFVIRIISMSMSVPMVMMVRISVFLPIFVVVIIIIIWFVMSDLLDVC